MEIKNDAHREFIEETEDFSLALSLGLRYCGFCAIPGTLTLVSDDTPGVQWHNYPGSLQCEAPPVCDTCREEMQDDPSPDMLKCTDPGCMVAVEDWREQKAAKKAPLFYAYEAYPDAGPTETTMEQDPRRGTPRGPTFFPAGDIRTFATEEARDAWVEDGPTEIKNEFGSIVRWRARSVVSQEKGSRQYVPDDEDTDAGC